EIVAIKELVAGPSLRVSALDDEIATLQKRFDSLKAEREDLVAHIESYRALTTPARRLPLDIIQEIFIACLPTDRNCVMSATEVPVFLGRICSSWRATSLSTPRLWSQLHIVEPFDYGSSMEKSHLKWTQYLEGVNMWLGRSGTCALSISVESVMGGSSDDMSYLFSRILIPLASRWRAVHFFVQPATLETFYHLTENDVPLLRDVSIAEKPLLDPNIDPPALSLADIGIFRGSSITTAAFKGVAVNRVTELPLQWSQLTSLHL
ncbi:hypothetical protein FB45DRAFT_715299, partial [Roridomyces roridus]